MEKHYIYLDESGTLDFDSTEHGRFFGIGTAHFVGDHSSALWDWHQLKIDLEKFGIQVPKGLHAKNDRKETRTITYKIISKQLWRFDSTFLLKSSAYPYIREEGKIRLYKMAIWLHLKYLIPKVSRPGDEIVVIVGDLKLSRRKSAVRNAIEDICNQLQFDRNIHLCIWDAASTWGIQVADYGLWRIQRELEKKQVPEYAKVIDNLINPTFFPWGK